ncbi:MFS transporter [Phycobacter sp. K97]|uniref:MFS transporter n=1 Tax=Phycobacter sedimenti TaxID=3133977 RepID=UPI00311E56AB
MWDVLRDTRYRHLFLAQVVAIVGTGLATVALGLVAYDLAGESAALVLGTVFTIKMVAYVGIAPLAAAIAERIDRRRLLVGLDLLRAAAALCLPFVSEIWQVYVLIFLMQAASAGFTPTFQATIPDVLPDEKRYTQALSLSRLAYDLESIVSPLLAGLLLAVASHNTLFLGTVLGFLGSAALVVSVTLPNPDPERSARRGIYDRTTRGIRIYLATPRLRGLLALCLSVSAAGAMVLVNSVVLVRAELGLSASALAWAMCAFGAGSMMAALVLPRLLDGLRDRPVMLLGALLMGVVLAILAVVNMTAGLSWGTLLLAWVLVGVGYSAVMTPSGRLLKRSTRPADRPAIFAAQFALSHACWLVSYPLSGWLMTRFGTSVTLFVLAVVTGLGCLAAARLWPTEVDPEVEHTHDNLPLDHPHLNGVRKHRHALVIDDEHPHWGDHFRG